MPEDGLTGVTRVAGVRASAKRVAILQSNYIPWKGYFDLIAAVDEFILYDDVQYTPRDWRNRNRIKTPQGAQWLTIPVRTQGRREQKIRDVETEGSAWQEAHWETLCRNYRRAAHFAETAAWLEPQYRGRQYAMLSDVNRCLIEAVCGRLGIRTVIRNSWDYPLEGGRVERLVNLCRRAGATEYVSGPAARSYLDEEAFAAAGVAVAWFDYDGYSPYPQLWGDFVHEVSILDLLFNCGGECARYMRYVPR